MSNYVNDEKEYKDTGVEPAEKGEESKSSLIKLILLILALIVAIALFLKLIVFNNDEEQKEDKASDTTTSSTSNDDSPITGRTPSRETTKSTTENDKDSKDNSEGDKNSQEGSSKNSQDKPGEESGETTTPEDDTMKYLDPRLKLLVDDKRDVVDSHGNRKVREAPEAEKYKDHYLPEKGTVKDPVPYDQRRHADKITDNEMNHDGGTMFDNSVASASEIASVAAKDMTSPVISEDGGYGVNIKQVIDRYGTEHAKKYGFRRWSVNDHSLDWKVIANGDGVKRIVSGVDIDEVNYYNDHLVKFTFKVTQRLLITEPAPRGEASKHTYSTLEPLKLDIYMKDEDNKWKIEAYDFPENKPTLY